MSSDHLFDLGAISKPLVSAKRERGKVVVFPALAHASGYHRIEKYGFDIAPYNLGPKEPLHEPDRIGSCMGKSGIYGKFD